MTRTCRVTLWPDRELVVSEQEYQGLLKQGLILPDPEPEQDTEDEQDTPDEPAPPPAAEPAPAPTSRPDKARRATRSGKD